jgi:hypothetical protein
LKRIAIALLPLCLALPAHAAGVALRWGSCEGYANRNFACNQTTGAEMLVGSFSPPAGIDELSGIQVYIRVSAPGTNLPSYWQMFNRGSCRATSLSASFDLSDQAECEDVWQGQAAGGIARYRPDGAGGVEMWLVAAVPVSAIHPVSPGRSYAAFKLMINHQRSTGAGACEGCSTPMCIEFTAIRLVQPPLPRPDGVAQERYTEITSGTSGMGGAANVVTWQGGTPSCGAGAAKPIKWGDLKKKFQFGQ